MARKRKDAKPYKPFESRKEYGGFTRISWDMMESKAYQDLTMRQRQLYFELKREYNPEKSTGGVVIQPNDQNILFPESKWKPLYKGNSRAWKIDRQALEDHGFIETMERGQTSRTPNVYKLSSKWKEWPVKEDRAVRKKDAAKKQS